MDPVAASKAHCVDWHPAMLPLRTVIAQLPANTVTAVTTSTECWVSVQRSPSAPHAPCDRMPLHRLALPLPRLLPQRSPTGNVSQGGSLHLNGADPLGAFMGAASP